MVMSIYYVSSAMDPNDFNELFGKSNKKPGQQSQKYNYLMMEGISLNGVPVHAITGRPITKNNYKSAFLKASKRKKSNLIYHYCSIINIPVIRNIWLFLAVFFSIIFNCQKKDAVVLDVLNATIAYAASLAAAVKKIICIGIVTDVPELMVTGVNKNHTRLVYKTLKRSTGFVFLTEAMNDRMNQNKKPFIIIEGISDIKENQTLNKPLIKSSPRSCIYAGYLDERYGVKTMTEAFMTIKPKAELHIYGDGPYSERLSEIAKKVGNIYFHGVVMNKEIVNLEKEATLLINPRPTNEEFVKYSFPSKNIEYMNSGTPLLTTKLPGMSKDYYDYIYSFEDESVEGMASTLNQVLSLPDEELVKMGGRAKQFICLNKNNQIQAKRLLDFIDTISSDTIL